MQTEAAAALARLGDEEGLERLKTLAKEPVVRTRVLYYLEELGATEKVDAAVRSPKTQPRGRRRLDGETDPLGVAPDSLELIDQTTQYWPGYVDGVSASCSSTSIGAGRRRSPRMRARRSDDQRLADRPSRSAGIRHLRPLRRARFRTRRDLRNAGR